MKTLSVAPAGTRQSVADVVVATGGGQPEAGELRARARAFAEQE